MLATVLILELAIILAAFVWAIVALTRRVVRREIAKALQIMHDELDRRLGTEPSPPALTRTPPPPPSR